MSHLRDDIAELIRKIKHEIASVEKEGMDFGPDFALGLCHRCADDWELYADDGTIPQWLKWIVLGGAGK